MKIRKNGQSIYENSALKKNMLRNMRHMRNRKKYVIIKGFNRFMYDRSLYRGRKHFCRYFLHALITEEILKFHFTNCFKINSKQTIKMSKKGEYVKFKNFERNIKPQFMIYADFQSILEPEDNEKENPNESYINKCQKHTACSCCYRLLCVDD